MRMLGGAVDVEGKATPTTSIAFSRVQQLWAGAHKYAPPAILAVCTVLLFWSAAQVFFVGDDFVWLYVGRTQMATSQGWITAFTHTNGAGTFRPLTQEIFFWLGWRLFGTDALGYHLLGLAAFVVTALLLYYMLTRLVASEWIAAGGTGLWAFSMAHYQGLDWTSAFSETGAVLCVALTLVAAVTERRVLMTLGYVAALLSNETATVIPALVLTYLLIWKGVGIRAAIMRTLPLWGAFVVYLLARLTFIGFNPSGPFALVLSPTVWLTLTGKSVLWLLGFNAALDNIALSQSALVTAAVLNLFVAIGAVIVAALVQVWRSESADTRGLRLITLGLLWFGIGLSPVLPIARDFSDYNLSVPLLGFPLILAGLAVAARRYGPALAVWVGVAYLFLNALGGYGPGGLSQVDGVATLSQQSHYAYEQMVAAEQQHPGRLHVVVQSDSAVVQWVLNNEWSLDLVSPGSEICFGTTTQRCMSTLPSTCPKTGCPTPPDLILRWDDTTNRFIP